eukprot:4346338-Alexandrium_andersonii.AAC.1
MQPKAGRNSKWLANSRWLSLSTACLHAVARPQAVAGNGQALKQRRAVAGGWRRRAAKGCSCRRRHRCRRRRRCHRRCRSRRGEASIARELEEAPWRGSIGIIRELSCCADLCVTEFTRWGSSG